MTKFSDTTLSEDYLLRPSQNFSKAQVGPRDNSVESFIQLLSTHKSPRDNLVESSISSPTRKSPRTVQVGMKI